MAQILVNNRLMKLSQAARPGQSNGGIKESILSPRKGQDRRQHRSRVNLNSRTNRKSIASSKQRRSPDRTRFGVDLREMLNAKRDQEGDMRTKLNGRKVAATSKVVLVSLVVRIARSE